jgi:hypothetical protein
MSNNKYMIIPNFLSFLYDVDITQYLIMYRYGKRYGTESIHTDDPGLSSDTDLMISSAAADVVKPTLIKNSDVPTVPKWIHSCKRIFADKLKPLERGSAATGESRFNNYDDSSVIIGAAVYDKR